MIGYEMQAYRLRVDAGPVGCARFRSSGAVREIGVQCVFRCFRVGYDSMTNDRPAVLARREQLTARVTGSASTAVVRNQRAWTRLPRLPPPVVVPGVASLPPAWAQWVRHLRWLQQSPARLRGRRPCSPPDLRSVMRVEGTRSCTRDVRRMARGIEASAAAFGPRKCLRGRYMLVIALGFAHAPYKDREDIDSGLQ